MHYGRAYLWLSMLAVAAACLRTAYAAPDPGMLPEPVATRQATFTIPFRLEPPRRAAEKPAEVQLYVSADLGATWQLANRIKPEEKAFVFRAPRDGEYWFSLKTLDQEQKIRPEGDPKPGLRVVVDTVPPRLDLQAARGQAGEVLAHWQAVDPNLKSGTFRLEYQIGPSEPWQEVAVEPATATAARHTLTAQATWWPKIRSGAITVRAQVADSAGNPAVSQVQVSLDASGGANTAASIPINTNQALKPPPLGDPFKSERPSTNSLAWPADRATNQVVGQAPPTPNPAMGDWRNAGSTPLDAQGRVSARPASQQTRTDGLDFSVMPPGERARMVNSRTFELEYEIDSVGPSGIGRVELWGTRDGGRTWSSFGLDTDNRSPMNVNVDGEGVYGFRIVLQSGSGFGGQPPREGDAAEIWIGVDLTRPTARITGADMGRDAGELSIRWEGSDTMPDRRPVALSFSDQAHGPWSPIAAGLENTGSYAWRLDNRVPEKVYLRLEFRDEAGNIGVYESPEPISLDRQRPQGHIRNVRPVN